MVGEDEEVGNKEVEADKGQSDKNKLLMKKRKNYKVKATYDKEKASKNVNKHLELRKTIKLKNSNHGEPLYIRKQTFPQKKKV